MVTSEKSSVSLGFEPYKHNDATVLGEIPEHVLDLKFSLGYGKNRHDKRWPPKAMTYKNLINSLSKHVVGTKDGAAFIQGTAIGNERKVPAIDALYVMGLDVDSGIHPEQAIERIQNLGLTAIIYTTHSHLKTDTFLVESSFNQWRKREKIAYEASEAPSLTHVRRYLREARFWEQWIVDTVTVGERDQTGEGVGWWLSHDPMPKFRIIFPLAEPFVIAKQHMSQLDAINLWKRKLVGLANRLELPIDQSCLDPSRLFYLPRHSEGSEYGVWVTGGEALVFEEVPEGSVKGSGQGQSQTNDPFARNAAQMGAGDKREHVIVGENFDLTKWVAQNKNGENFDIASLFRNAAPGQVRNEQTSTKLTVTCPFDHTHSNAGDQQDKGCYVESPDPATGINSFVFSCSHNSCKGRDRLEFVAEAVNQGWFTKDDLEDKDLHLGLTDEPPADVQKLLDDALAAIETLDKKNVREAQRVIIEHAEKLFRANVSNGDMEVLVETAKNRKIAGVKVIKEWVRMAYSRVPVAATAMDDDNGSKTLFASLDEGVAALNKFAAIVALPGKVKVVIESAQEGSKQIKPNMLDPTSAGTLLKNYRYLNKDREPAPLFPAWLEHDDARRYLSATFDPTGNATKEYNFWKGFNIDPDLEASWDLTKRHILLHFCAGNPTHAIWFLSWLSQMLQDPTNLMGTSLVVRSGQGGGKSTMSKIFRTILGAHFTSIAQREQLTGKFNKHLANKLLIVAEEAVWSKDHEAASVLKDKISNDSMNLEGKGFDIETDYPDPSRIIFLSNEYHIIPATDDARRFMCLAMIEPAENDSPAHKAYFDALYAEIEAGAAAGMFDFLLKYDHSRVDLRRPPKTALFRQQVAANLDQIPEWFVGCIEAGNFYDSQYAPANISSEATPSVVGKWNEESILVDAAQVFASFTAKVRGYRGQRGSDTACGTFLKTIPGVERVGDKFKFPPKPDLEKWLVGKGWMEPSVIAPPPRWDGDWPILDSLPDPALAGDVFYDAGREMEIEATLSLIFDDSDPAQERAVCQ